MKPSLRLLALLAACTLFAACDKAAEKASEKMAEKAIESNLKDGTKASVTLSEGGAKVVTTDASGKSSTMEWGTGQVNEAELGLPFYPGSKPLDGGGTRMQTPDGTALSVTLHTADASDKVAAFYRDKLKAQPQGKNFMEMNLGEGGINLSLADDKSKNAMNIHIAKASSAGSDINIVVTRNAAK